jgi:predicted nuclease of predicted toxin-antitoxin system
MKLLFDQNLSFKLCGKLADLFPGSNQVRLAGLDMADDRAIWEFAKVGE